ncbi:MAG TPA: hypothetical protein VFU02_14870 [Polyangiaceae bacterium]|nr:hypothetical protein [Polyangiaceae bacterium]
MNLEQLDSLVGTWALESTHPAFPGVVVHGSAAIDWLEGNRFLIQRARIDHPDFPDSISIIGDMGSDRVEDSRSSASDAGAWGMHYFDSRGVFRVYQVSLDAGVWRIWRNAPEFSQRFTGTLAHEGKTIVGRWELCRDDKNWNTDLEITYRRSS